MKTKPSKTVLKTKKLSNLWFMIWIISAIIFIACSVAISIKMINPVVLVILLLAMLCLIISTLCVHTYETRLRNLEIRDAHPAFRFHDWFQENKDELIKNGTLVPLDEVIRQQNEKSSEQNQG